MSGDEVDFQSKLEDLESFVELLSPFGAQSQETLVVDFAQHIDFDVSQGFAIFDIGVHTDSNMSNTDTVNELKVFFLDSSPITEVDFARMKLLFPRTRMELRVQRSIHMHMG